MRLHPGHACPLDGHCVRCLLLDMYFGGVTLMHRDCTFSGDSGDVMRPNRSSYKMGWRGVRVSSNRSPI
jgi:hypothetical protein